MQSEFCSNCELTSVERMRLVKALRDTDNTDLLPSVCSDCLDLTDEQIRSTCGAELIRRDMEDMDEAEILM